MPYVSKQIPHVAVFAIVLLIVTGCDDTPTDPGPPPSEVTITVEGEVRGSEPVASAEVAIFPVENDDPLDQTTSDSEGVYELSFAVEEDEKPDWVVLRTEADGYALYERTLEVSESISYDIELETEGTEAQVSGKVTEEETGDPIGDATITGTDGQEDADLFETNSNQDGTYEASFMVTEEPDEVIVEVEADGYSATSVEVAFDEQMVADVTMQTALFAGGTGTADDPYRIETIEQLQAIDKERNAHFMLTADIDATETSEWNDGAGFEPIGDVNPGGFSGVLDGNDRTIDGLTIQREDEDNVGIFEFMEGATVRNLDLTNVSVSGNTRVGGLVGWSEDTVVLHTTVEGHVKGHRLAAGGLAGRFEEGEITDTHMEGQLEGVGTVGGLLGTFSGELQDATADVTIEADRTVGGLAGDIFGDAVVESASAEGQLQTDRGSGGLVGRNRSSTISNAAAYVDVMAINEEVGGLVGRNTGDIETSYATGDVHTERDKVGGLVGLNTSDATITASFASGAVSTDFRRAGGLLGTNEGEAVVRDCYATGSVADDGNGGLVGWNLEDAEIHTSYAVGEIIGDGARLVQLNSRGPLHGGNAVLEGSYYIQHPDHPGVAQGEDDGATGLETSEMTGSQAVEYMPAFDFEETWQTVSDDFPALWWEER